MCHHMFLENLISEGLPKPTSGPHFRKLHSLRITYWWCVTSPWHNYNQHHPLQDQKTDASQILHCGHSKQNDQITYSQHSARPLQGPCHSRTKQYSRMFCQLYSQWWMSLLCHPQLWMAQFQGYMFITDPKALKNAFPDSFDKIAACWVNTQWWQILTVTLCDLAVAWYQSKQGKR